MSQDPTVRGPDFTQGVVYNDLKDDVPILGHVGADAVVLVKKADAIYAVGAVCTHYSGPLAEGLVVGETLRCPWHHACFSLRTGEALAAPAFHPILVWRTEVRSGRVYVTEKIETAVKHDQSLTHPRKVVIIGAGAAGSAAA